MNLADALSVAADMQTTAGLFWPVPVVNLTETGMQQAVALRSGTPTWRGTRCLQ